MSVEDKVRSVKVNDAVIVDGCMVRVLAVTPDGRAVVSMLVFRCLFFVGAMLHRRRSDIDSLKDGGGK